MANAKIAINKFIKHNSSLQLLLGSIKIGRINYALLESEQLGVDLKRLEVEKKHLDLVYCEMFLGDILFFHCNIPNRSDKNNSASRRWTLLCC